MLRVSGRDGAVTAVKYGRKALNLLVTLFVAFVSALLLNCVKALPSPFITKVPVSMSMFV